ncbi:MAG: molybdate ABC transporter permease subunit [Proteobacteria bacterium]|nr:molybdate ABC transporter permease subunit [Pseudomonadota bacterium]
MTGLTAEDWQAVHLSLRVATVGTLAILPLAVAVGWLLARVEFRGKVVLDALVHLPLVVPPVVTGYALLLLFGRRGVFGGALAEVGIVFSFRWTGAALAAAIMGFPLMVRAIRLSIEAIDARLEQAASTLGARPLFVFATVTLPLAWPGILAGAVLCFAKALGEFGATITFVSSIPGETRTIPAAIYGYVQTPGADDGAWRLSLVAVGISIAALAFSEWLSRRMREART